MRTVTVPSGNASLLTEKGSGSHLFFNSDQASVVTLGDNPSIDPNYGDNTVPLSPQSYIVLDGKSDVYGVVPAGQSAVVNIYKGGTNFFQAVVPVVNPGFGLRVLTGGGTVTAATITAAKSAGFQGLLLDSLFPWDMSGLSFNGIQNFKIRSEMLGSIGWSANVSHNTPGLIKTDTGGPVDGISVFASSPGGNPTQGIIFENLVFVGSNSRSVVHLGGGQRQCGFRHCHFENTAITANSYAVAHDTGLSDNNSEDDIFEHCSMSGGWAALGIGVFDQTQHCNDTFYEGLVTASRGPYSIVHNSGGNHAFSNWYDRSNPSIATVWNHGPGGRLNFFSGEHQNTTGASHLIDGTGQTILYGCTITQAGAQNTTVNISAGSLILRGTGQSNGAQTWAISGTAVIDLSDPAWGAATATINGAAGIVLVAGNYAGQGSPPILTSFTGTLVNPFYANGGWITPLPVNGWLLNGAGVALSWRLVGDAIEIVGDLTAPPVAPNVIFLTLPAGFNVPHSQVIPTIDRTTGQPVGHIRVQGSPANFTMVGQTANDEVAFTGRVYTTP